MATIREALISQAPSLALQRAAADEIARLDKIIEEVHSWVVCGAIATPEDMAYSFPRIAEITEPKHARH